MKKILITVFLLAFAALPATRAYAQYGTSSGTTTISVTIGSLAGLTITNSSTPLTLNSASNSYTGTTNLTYYVRTSTVGGHAAIDLEVTSDFSPGGGPSVASPPSATDKLKYTCTAAAPGTPCAGTANASTTALNTVATFGTNAHTTSSGSTASVSWSLANDPQYQTGTYVATVTFTISAL